MNDAGWEITEVVSGIWWVQVEGSFRESDEVLICEGLTNEEAMAIAAASGRVLVYADGRRQKFRSRRIRARSRTNGGSGG